MKESQLFMKNLITEIEIILDFNLNQGIWKNII